MKVCILTAGKGARMGPIDKNINKALLPIQNKAIISHIIESFSPDDEFVIGLGYFGQQVRDYLNVAYPDRLFHFVNIDNFDGPGSGPGYSLLCCEKYLQEPFFFIPCDCIFEADFKSVPSGNWIGAKVVDSAESENYCNVLVKDSIVVDIRDKEKCGGDYLAFTGLLYVRDSKEFLQSLKDKTTIKGEHQISNGLKGLVDGSGLFAVEVNWTDVGELEKYQSIQKNESEYNFEKTDEFIYFVNNQVIKFFANKKSVADRVKKSRLNPKTFPKVTGRGEQFYSYPFSPGETFYSSGTPILFKKLLEWLNENLWNSVNIESKTIKELCNEFYYKKTKKRIELFQSRNPNYKFPTKINGKKVQPIIKLVENIPWDYLCSGVPTFIHGDLQFDNIIYDKESDNFLLIDWRQDFAGEIDFGDIYYDLAKLLGGILLNYDYIKKGLFRYIDHEDGVLIDFARRTSAEEYEKLLGEFIVSKGLDLRKVRLLVGIIYINMAALHHPPFNFVLIALGTSMINEELHMQ